LSEVKIVFVVQALIVFGADWRLKNAEGDTAWTVVLKSFQSKFGFAGVERERNVVLHCLHSVGAEVVVKIVVATTLHLAPRTSGPF
jgi:hypothetical protein